MTEQQLIEQINTVVEAREKAQEATEWRTSAYQKWVEANQPLLDNESDAKSTCQEAEAKLREMTIQSYVDTGNKSALPGIGIRIMTRLTYDNQMAMEWAVEHKLALKLDAVIFEKIAKTSGLPFVTIAEEPTATIAADLKEITGWED